MGCASAFQADKASSSLAARSISPRSSSGPGCSPFKRDDIGSNPIRGSILPGCGRGRTDPPLKRRSHARARTFESCSRLQRSASAGKGFSLIRRTRSVRPRHERPIMLASSNGRTAHCGCACGGSTPPASAKYRCSSAVERRSPKPRQRGFNPYHRCQILMPSSWTFTVCFHADSRPCLDRLWLLNPRPNK
jgi:hypothetical protein